MEGQPGAAFGLVLFDSQHHTPLGATLYLATEPESVNRGLSAVEGIVAVHGNGNGGEAAALETCLQMAPDAVFFLGDGSWCAFIVQNGFGESLSILEEMVPLRGFTSLVWHYLLEKTSDTLRILTKCCLDDEQGCEGTDWRGGDLARRADPLDCVLHDRGWPARDR